MWHSISAGVRAARHDANLQGKAHPQAVSPSDLDVGVAEDATGGERIAVDHDDGALPDVASTAESAPQGGYQDPDRRDAAPKSRKPRRRIT
jgi:hypothetical protein